MNTQTSNTSDLIQTRCPACQKRLKVGCGQLGRSIRCPACTSSFELKREVPVASPSDTASTEQSGTPRIVKIAVISAVSFCLLMILGAYFLVKSRQWRHEAERSKLEAKLNEAVQRSNVLVAGFDYPGALNSLNQINEEVVKFGDRDLTDRVEASQRELQSSQFDYKRKLKSGWAIFEGRLTSPDEKRVILQDREDKRIKLENEERQGEEDRQKLAQAKRTEQAAAAAKAAEESRRRAEADRIEKLKSDPIASFNDYAPRFKKAADAVLKNYVKVPSRFGGSTSSYYAKYVSRDVRKTDSLVAPVHGLITFEVSTYLRGDVEVGGILPVIGSTYVYTIIFEPDGKGSWNPKQTSIRWDGDGDAPGLEVIKETQGNFDRIFSLASLRVTK